MKKRREHKDNIYILSIDGGGIRGIIPVMVLMEMERRLAASNPDKPLSSYFDLIAGTSTGGLIGLALASPASRLNLFSAAQEEQTAAWGSSARRFSYHTNWGFREMYSLKHLGGNRSRERSEENDDDDARQEGKNPPAGEQEIPGLFETLRRKLRNIGRGDKTLEQEAVDLEKILEIYEERGEEIFPKSTFRQLQSIGQMFTDKYDESSLERLLSTIFTDLTMKEAAVPVTVCTYDCNRGRPYLMSSYSRENFYMRDAARATSAAPTYFSPYTLSPIGEPGKSYCLIDGGVAANNPALIGYLEAKKLYPDAKHYHIISLGTASRPFSMEGESQIRGGVMGWMDPARGAPLYHVFRSSQEGMTKYALDSLPDVTAYRLDGSQSTARLKLDDASREHIALLKSIGKNILSERHDVLESCCRLLAEAKE